MLTHNELHTSDCPPFTCLFIALALSVISWRKTSFISSIICCQHLKLNHFQKILKKFRKHLVRNREISHLSSLWMYVGCTDNKHNTSTAVSSHCFCCTSLSCFESIHKLYIILNFLYLSSIVLWAKYFLKCLCTRMITFKSAKCLLSSLTSNN